MQEETDKEHVTVTSLSLASIPEVTLPEQSTNTGNFVLWSIVYTDLLKRKT